MEMELKIIMETNYTVVQAVWGNKFLKLKKHKLGDKCEPNQPFNSPPPPQTHTEMRPEKGRTLFFEN